MAIRSWVAVHVWQEINETEQEYSEENQQYTGRIERQNK
jgi:hypothetical protein